MPEKKLISPRLQRAVDQGFDIETPYYHVTDDIITEFDTSKTQDSSIWLTKDKESIKNGIGAAGSKYIMELYIRSDNLAGWDEYEKYTTDQLIQQGYDGALLDDDVTLFYPEQIRSVNARFYPENINSTKLVDDIKRSPSPQNESFDM